MLGSSFSGVLCLAADTKNNTKHMQQAYQFEVVFCSWRRANYKVEGGVLTESVVACCYPDSCNLATHGSTLFAGW